MPLPIEIRIHGVGGSTPHALLCEHDPEDVLLVRGTEKSGFWARRSDPTVQGYVWGPLTSGSKLQPLWIVLLPFTLLNVAGWMHRPVTSCSQRRTWWTRWLVTVLGFTLTIIWALWLCVIVADLVAYRAGRQLTSISTGQFVAIGVGGFAIAAIGFAWRARGSLAGWPLVGLGAAVSFGALVARTLESSGWRGTWGVVGAGLIMLVIFFIAGQTRRTFEKSSYSARVEQARRRLRDNETLASPSFFAHPEDSGWLLYWHAVTTVITLAVAIFWVWKRAAVDHAATLDFGGFIAVVGAVQFALLLALVLVCIGEWDRLDRRWRIMGPAVAAILSLMLSNGIFAGLALWVRQRLNANQVPVRLGSPQLMPAPLGAEFTLLDVFVGATLVFAAIMLLGWLPYFLAAKPSDAADMPEDWCTRVALRRRLARAFRHIDIPLSAWALVSLSAGMIIGLLRLARVEGCDGICWTLAVDRFGVAPLRSLGEWVLPFAPIALSLLIRQGARSIGARRNIGNLWDVLTFWPRRFHPLGVRPYAELAVPELQRYLEHCCEHEDAAVVVSAHSQGSILAFAALRGLDDPFFLKRVALVTYGSPLDRLHARFFPCYFNGDEFRALRQGLFDQEHGWQNFYRRTDHIGQRVFDEVPEATSHDQLLPDPTMSEPVHNADERPLERGLEPLRTIAGHNYYLRERQLKNWV
ncbi:MAG: hypothetical protein ACRDYX_21510, partial [Egibacteraceae bacterium]